uniref:Uncharacterized protein n=1 Tax=Rhizophora mucronata TaxID=61149 RepID=A0A2P2NZ64_RHIMU
MLFTSLICICIKFLFHSSFFHFLLTIHS